MSNLSPQKIVYIAGIALLSAVLFVGCSHHKTKRGHLFRGDWALEYNRTPWIGCPPNIGCDDTEDDQDGCELFDCFKKETNKKRAKRYRHHCAMNEGCIAKEPCCRTLGCGMWVEPKDATAPVVLGGPARACCLTPFCTIQNPCRVTYNCGKPIAVSIDPQTLLQAHQNGTPTVRGMSPGPSVPGGMVGGTMPVTLVSRGIVPGASAINSGGVVAAIGVATPAGTMTPVGVRLPNGAVSNAIVLRACTMTPNCTAGHPCGLTPNCGGAVAVNMVTNNAIALASTLQAQGATIGVMQAGGGMLVNPLTNQPISGLTMSGYPQAGYPPIGYAPTGYAPGYPRPMGGVGMIQGETEEMEVEQPVLPETRSSMPVPRFHPIPSQPTFQRKEGMPSTPMQQRTVAKPTTTAMSEGQAFSEMAFESALDKAYLEGVSAAMEEVERKLESRRQAVAQAKLKEKIIQQTEYLQQQLDTQEEQHMLAMQRERQLRQQTAIRQAATQQAEVLTATEPRRLSPQNQASTVRGNVLSNANPAQLNPVQFAENLKNSVANGANGLFGPLLESNQRVQPPMRVQSPQNQMVAVKANNGVSGSTAQLAENLKTSVVSGVEGMFAPLLGSDQKTRAGTEVAAALPQLPARPSVLPVAQGYGLLADDGYDEDDSGIMQARFTADGQAILP